MTMVSMHPPRILILYGSLRRRAYSRLLAEEPGRWMRMFTIPNQSSVDKAYEQFHADGHMKDSPYRDRMIDLCEELIRFTLLLRDQWR